VALARTLANDPPLILADEPAGNLDAYMREQILGLLESLCYFGKIVVMATHDPAAAGQVGRVLRLADGVLRARAA
jgi:putative ABC transport system ATP-binding protein